jgi:hypothetical protein
LWFPPAQIPLGFGQVGLGKTVPPVLVLTAGYSRFLAATMIPTRNAADLVLGQWAVLRQLGGVPRLLVWDGEGGVGRYGGPNPKLTAAFTALRGMLGTFYVCKPNDPETKGLTELTTASETSFLPGAGSDRRLQRPAGRVPGAPTPASDALQGASGKLSVQTWRRWARSADRHGDDRLA